MAKAKEYTVGRGKPPKQTQFKKGESGNPAGRPKGSKNFQTDFMEEMQTLIEINEAGVKQRITKQRALIKRMTNSALAGDHRAMEMVAKHVISFSVVGDEGAGKMSEDDLLLLEQYFVGRLGGGNAASS